MDHTIQTPIGEALLAYSNTTTDNVAVLLTQRPLVGPVCYLYCRLTNRCHQPATGKHAVKTFMARLSAFGNPVATYHDTVVNTIGETASYIANIALIMYG